MKRCRFYYSPVINTTTVAFIGDVFDPDNIVGYKNMSKPYQRITICSVLNDEGTELSFGVAVCSKKDKFIREVGRKIAYDRAINNPYKKAAVTKENISRVRISTCDLIEEEVFAMDQIKF